MGSKVWGVAEPGKARRLEFLLLWLRRWGQVAKVARVAARTPIARRVGTILLIPLVLLALAIFGIVRSVTG